jgi:hypothetical protein
MEMVIVLNPGVDTAKVAVSAACCVGRPSTASGVSTDR